jgi:hydrogenase maturation protease
MTMTPYLILGIGNILLSDEGVGVHVVETIQSQAAAGQIRLPEDVDVFDGGTFGIDLIDTLAGRRKVICIDAVAFDGPPGTVIRFSAADLAEKKTADMSLHQLGLLETLQMARQLGCAPQEVVIFGIVPKDISPGLEMTAEVAAVVPKVIDLVLKELGP